MNAEFVGVLVLIVINNINIKSLEFNAYRIDSLYSVVFSRLLNAIHFGFSLVSLHFRFKAIL
jgi:hypothetical protein